MGTVARITEFSQYEGVALRMLIDSILECDDILLLLNVVPVPGCSPLVTQFLIHPEMIFHLRIVVFLDYKDEQLWFLAKPTAPETVLATESLPISPALITSYHFRVAFLHENSVPDGLTVRHVQLLPPSMPLWILIDAIIGQASFVCTGPENPYVNTSQQTDVPHHWLPASLLGNTTYFQWMMTLSVQVSQCPSWAFTTSNHIIRYLVAEVLS